VACKEDIQPSSVVIGIPQTEIEEIVFEANDRTKSGRVITAFFPEFILVACYLPSWGGKELRNEKYKRDYETAFYKYLLTLDSTLPIILCGDLNDTPEQRNSYLKNTILPVRDFVDSYKYPIQPTLLGPPQPSPAKRKKKDVKPKGSPGSTYYAEDNSRSKLPLIDPLDRSDTNGVRQVVSTNAQSRLLLP
jgi:hypothetical protein